MSVQGPDGAVRSLGQQLFLGVPALLGALILGAIGVQSQSRRLKSRYRPPDKITINTVEITAPECRPNPG
jgi:hypothetical protein